MPSQILTPDEAHRAIYVDFEGNQNKPTTLLGVLIEGELDQFIVEEAFRDCADRNRARAGWSDGPALAVQVVRRAVEEDRLIVSWSRHDHGLLRDLLRGRTEQSEFEDLYRNALKTARRWRNLEHPAISGRHTLRSYMDLLGWQVPADIGHGTVGPALSYCPSPAAGQGRKVEQSHEDAEGQVARRAPAQPARLEGHETGGHRDERAAL